MKNTVVLAAFVLTSNLILAQNRGARNNSSNNVYVIQQSNPINNSNLNVYSNLDNNLGNMNYSNVQLINAQYNNVQQQSAVFNTRNLNNAEKSSSRNLQTEQQLNNRVNDVVRQDEPILEINSAPVNEVVQIKVPVRNVPEPIQQMPIDNVDDQLAINVSEFDLNLDNFVIENEGNTVPENSNKDGEVDFALEVSAPSLEMPNLNIDMDLKIVKKVSISKEKKVKRPKGFRYQQHVSIKARIDSKFSVVKKVLKKSKQKKVVCSVVCYQF